MNRLQEVVLEYQGTMNAASEILREKIREAEEAYAVAVAEAREFLIDVEELNYRSACNHLRIVTDDEDSYINVCRFTLDGLGVGFDNPNGPDELVVLPWSQMAYPVRN